MIWAPPSLLCRLLRLTSSPLDSRQKTTALRTTLKTTRTKRRRLPLKTETSAASVIEGAGHRLEPLPEPKKSGKSNPYCSYPACGYAVSNQPQKCGPGSAFTQKGRSRCTFWYPQCNLPFHPECCCKFHSWGDNKWCARFRTRARRAAFDLCGLRSHGCTRARRLRHSRLSIYINPTPPYVCPPRIRPFERASTRTWARKSKSRIRPLQMAAIVASGHAEYVRVRPGRWSPPFFWGGGTICHWENMPETAPFGRNFRKTGRKSRNRLFGP